MNEFEVKLLDRLDKINANIHELVKVHLYKLETDSVENVWHSTYVKPTEPHESWMTPEIERKFGYKDGAPSKDDTP